MMILRKLRFVLSAALLGGVLAAAPTPASARVFLSVAIAPPVIPVYTQPVCRGEGCIWTPGCWAWRGDVNY